jgi:tagatose-1,6-bisphosphate aldolase
MNLQHDWDTCLLNGFYKYPDHSTYFLFRCFVEARQLTEEQIASIKRMPNQFEHGKVPILRFICAYLPKIADILWKHKPEEIETLALAMSKSNYDTLKVMTDKVTHDMEVNEIRRSRNKMVQFAMSDNASHDNWDRHLRNNSWGITK